jgi:hypothetical protein
MKRSGWRVASPQAATVAILVGTAGLAIAMLHARSIGAPLLHAIEVACRLVVGVLFLVAGTGKLMAPDHFATVLRRFPVTGVLLHSQRQARQAGTALAVVEVMGGALFVLGYQTLAVGAVFLVLLAAFSAGVTLVLVRGQRLPCGCLDPIRAAPVRWTAILRNLALAALVLVGTQPVALSADAALDGELRPATLSALAAFCVLLGLVSWLGRPQLASAGLTLTAWLKGEGAGPGRHQPTAPALFAAEGNGGGGRDRGDLDDSRVNRLWEDYDDAAAAHRRASGVVAVLDHQLQAVIDDASLDGAGLIKSAAWQEQEERLVELDTAVNDRIASLYDRALAVGGPEAERLLIRTALLHWVVLLRRTAMRSYHTQVEGLVDDRDCAGDVIADDLLLDYFDALFEPREGVGAEVAAVRTLTVLARQSACLGQQQSALLASHLYWSFVELRSFLRLNGLERLVRTVTQAMMAPLLLFYDVEQYRGLNAPLARWFQEVHPALVEGAGTGRLPAVWHGLWLYDRRTGHLIGYRASQEPADENEVHLRLFLDSIISHENLGRFQCSFAEMIERGPSQLGYLCGGVDCAEQDPKAVSAHTIGQRNWLARRAAQLGFSSAQHRQVGCEQAAGGGSTGGGVRSGACGGGLAAGDRSPLSRTVACISEQAMEPAERTLRCMAEALGMCADPIEKAAKLLQESLFVGVRLGNRCGIAAENGGDGSDWAKKAVENKEKEFDEQYKKAYEAAKNVEEARTKEEAAKNQATEASREYVENPTPETEKARREANDAYSKATIDRIDAEANARAEEQKLDGAGQDLQRAYMNEWKWRMRNEQRCPPDTPDCGGNDCTAMAAALNQTLACQEELINPEAARPFGGIDPGVVDPSPLDDPTSPSWLQCLEILPDARLSSKQCWAVDCGPMTTTTVSVNGVCRCEQSPVGQPLEGGLLGGCGQVDCPEGQLPSGFGCSCAPTGGFDGIGSGGPIPIGPLQPNGVKSMAEARGGDVPGLNGPALPLP